MLKTLLLVSALIANIVAYIPLFRRFRKRHHTRDFSKAFQALIFLVQINNGILAYLERAEFLVVWYVVQTIFTGLTLWLVCRYWDAPQPPLSSMHDTQNVSDPSKNLTTLP